MSSSDGNKDLKEGKSLKTGSQSSLSSIKSLGMGQTLQTKSDDSEEIARKLTPEGGSPPGESLYDCIAYVIYCPTHDTIAVSNVERAKAVWLPFIACPPSKTWRDASNDGILIILSKEDQELDKTLQHLPPIHKTSVKCLQVLRIQLPITEKFITRLIYFVKLKEREHCCEKTKRIQWIPMKDVLTGNIENVWGPEVKQFGSLSKNAMAQGINEYGLKDAFFYVPKNPPRNLEEHMLSTLGINIEKDIEILYGDFIEHCFPSFYMSTDSYKDYMTKYGYEREDSRFPLLFNAFNYNENGFLSFHELLLGLASMEPNTVHGEGRVKFVFRYYDRDNDGFLSEDEFKNLIKDLSPNDDEKSLQNKMKDGMNAIGLMKNKIAFKDFFAAVGAKKFRGTSTLCRSAKAILTQVSKSMASRTDLRTTEKNNARFLKANRRNKGICMGCKGKKYDYGLHAIRLDTDGRCVEPRIIFEPEDHEDQINSRYSIEYVFNATSIANVFIDMIKEFNPKKGTSHHTIGFLSAPEERAGFVRYLQMFCSHLENLFISEERIMKINSPTYLFGDIYGNLDDLLKMEKHLWQSFPIISANYVFLGNYVDKGKWGLECIIYLFALKLIAPNKIILLRGHHEVREVQLQNSFQKECFEKYGEDFGKKIWELINEIFDKLPLSVIVDESIFCSHSGIPNSKQKVIDFDIDSDLENPEKDPIAWELLCNEPITESSATSSRIDSRTGFGPNTNRGTGYLFNEVAVNRFLRLNGFTHIICGNGLTTNGYAFHFSGKFLAVFSSSRFCDKNNESVAVFLDAQKIRIVRLDTTITTNPS